MDDKSKIEVPSIPKEQIQKITTQSEDFREMYFNHARLAIQYWDLRIFFGVNSFTPQNEPTFQDRLCAVLTPEFAKSLWAILGSALDDYESKFGPIRPNPIEIALREDSEQASSEGK